jgi:hypothetical protein
MSLTGVEPQRYPPALCLCRIQSPVLEVER